MRSGHEPRHDVPFPFSRLDGLSMGFSLHTQGQPAREPRAASERAFEVCGISHRGLVRVHNEDFWFADEKFGLAIVADGVGGQADGALASRAAVDCVAKYLR